MEGSETADRGAKAAAEDPGDRVKRRCVQGAGLADEMRLVPDTNTRGAMGGVSNHVSNHREYRPPEGGSIRKDLKHERKALFSWYYQVLSGHAATGVILFNRL